MNTRPVKPPAALRGAPPAAADARGASRERLARQGRRITGTLFATQSLGSAGVISLATVASIVGAEVSGRDALAGAPGAVFLLGTALLALPWSLATDALGRRGGLALGGLVGALGAAGAVLALTLGSFPLLLLALLVAGSGQAAFRLGRFAAAEATPLRKRGRAVATVVLGGTVGSVLGPLLVAPAGAAAAALGGPPLAGAYGAAATLFALAALTLTLGLRPDPRRVARLLAQLDPAAEGVAVRRPLRELARSGRVRRAVGAMVLAQAVMVLVMGITSLHMHHLGQPLRAISLVFGAHTLGMFAFSLLSGWLADRWGRLPVIRSGALLLLLACALAPLRDAFGPLLAALFVLGLGWNLCYVGGSALLADELRASERGRAQGVNDLFIGLVAASASLAGGVLYAGFGFFTLSMLGVAASAALLLAVGGSGRTPTPREL